MEERTLKQRWETFKAANPKVRIRDAAKQLGVSEAELVATNENNIRLRSDMSAILELLPTLADVMALTRNDAVVHEVTAPFQGMRQRDNTVMFFREGQDTRYFTEAWSYAYAVNENERLSLQFFDTQGDAVHKVYLKENSELKAYQCLIKRFKADDQTPLVIERTTTVIASDTSQTVDIDAVELRQQWAAIRNVHQGNQIIKAHGDRLAAYRALGDEYAKSLPVDSVEFLLTDLSEQQAGCMIFVMNEHAVQSFAGKISRLMRTGPWFNVLDPHFNLHLRTEAIAQVWMIRKPSDDGWVHSFSIFDEHEQEIMIVTDQRSRGEEESATWLNVISPYLDTA